MGNKKYIIMFVIGILILFVIYIIVPDDKKQVNEKINTGNTVGLLKKCKYDLIKSPTLTEGMFTDDSMVNFARSYIILQDETRVEYDMKNSITKIDVDLVANIVKYIFDKELDVTKVTYEIKEQKIYIPTNFDGGDMQIYKYKELEYDKQTDTYIIYIDCLEPDMEHISDVFKDSTTSYNKELVIATMQIKYRIRDNRYIFLAYNVEYENSEE